MLHVLLDITSLFIVAVPITLRPVPVFPPKPKFYFENEATLSLFPRYSILNPNKGSVYNVPTASVFSWNTMDTILEGRCNIQKSRLMAYVLNPPVELLTCLR